MNATRRLAHIVLFAVLLAGCSGDGVKFPDLHPAKGVVKRGNAPVSGGAVQLRPPDGPGDYIISGVVGSDGTFTLATAHKDDKRGERKPGAPAGTYKATYMPPAGDQTASPVAGLGQVEVPTTLTVTAGENNLTIDLSKK